jgi:purine nucleosidase
MPCGDIILRRGGKRMSNRRFFIDTDTASDDAVAILMALNWPDVHVEGISAVYGNVPLEQASRNARTTVELCRTETPVHEGLHRPLLREPVHAEFFHGADGMGGMNFPEPRRRAASKEAISEILRAFRDSPGEITLVTLGPLTNIATALRIEPRLAEWVRQCYVMGGAACTVGNITPAAEYNIWCDPEAARIVFHSGMKILMVGWEHCRGEANLDDDDIDTILDFGTKRAKFAIDINRSALKANREWLGEPGIPLPDPVTMAIALEPKVCTERSRHYVDVSCDQELTRGMTVVDERDVTQKEPNIDVCWEIDIELWKETLYRTLR